MSAYMFANAAKGSARQRLLEAFGVTGVGIAVLGEGDYGVKVNLSHELDTSELPQTINGVPVIYEVVGTVAAG